MISRPINYIFLEGPDLSGKTTLYEDLHKCSNYRWNIQDRSALSMLIHAKLYEREEFRHVEQLRSELYNLNNITIILLPEWEEIARRFNLRGDPIQNITSLRKLHQLYTEAASELQTLPNVFVVRKPLNKDSIKYMIESLRGYEKFSTKDIQQSCLTACDSRKDKEILGLNFTLYDDGDFLDVDEGDLLYEEEVDYYEEILSGLKSKIDNELMGDNPYGRKETFQSRRFIYSSETCISLAHFLLREEGLDCKFFLRSSNVKDTLYYDINFLKHLSSVVYKKVQAQGKFCRMNFTINSGHIIQEEEDESKN